MTVTEPLATESDLDQMAVDEITIDLTAIDAAIPVQPETVTEVEPSLWRDPLLPFLVIGTLSLIAVIIAAFMLSSGTVTI